MEEGAESESELVERSELLGDESHKRTNHGDHN